MSNSQKKYEWLQFAFTEHVDSINESYYFDKQDNEFFSVFITDFFLTDSTSTESYPENPYSKQELEVLTRRLDRLEQKDRLILPIPRLTVAERQELMWQFLGTHRDLENLKELQGLIESENGRTKLDFNDLLQSDKQNEWLLFKKEFLIHKIDRFCNLNNIDISSASLWVDTKMTSMTLDLGIKRDKNLSKGAKPWWKIWL